MHREAEPESKPLDREAEAGFRSYTDGLGLELPHGPTLTPTVWPADGALMVLDQRRLPEQMAALVCRPAEQAAWAIRRLTVRGAPAMALGAVEIFRTAGSDTERGVAVPPLDGVLPSPGHRPETNGNGKGI